MHPNLAEYFSKIKAQKVDETLTIEEKLDALLENFITSYDDAELSLRREERMLQLWFQNLPGGHPPSEGTGPGREGEEGDSWERSPPRQGRR